MCSRRNTEEDVHDGIIYCIKNWKQPKGLASHTIKCCTAEKINELKLWERQILNL